MNPADHYVKKMFYLFGPVVFLVVRVAHSFHFLKSTFSVLGPDFCDGCGQSVGSSEFTTKDDPNGTLHSASPKPEL